MASRKVMIAAIEASRTSARISTMGRKEQEECLNGQGVYDRDLKAWHTDTRAGKKGRKKVAWSTFAPFILILVMIMIALKFSI